jgi:ParB family chromosome partitioning protein
VQQESLLTEEIFNSIIYIKVELLIPFRNQARRNFDTIKIEELSKSIQNHGLRQPLTVIESLNLPQHFEVISGERRLRACKLLDFDKVPCIIIHDQKKAEEIALVENIQREDLHPIEIGIAYANLLSSNLDYSQEKIAEKLGVPRTQVVEYLKFSKIPEDITALIIDNNITTRAFLRRISAATTYEEQCKIINHEIAHVNTTKSTLITPKLRKKFKLLNIYYESDRLIIDKKALFYSPKQIVEQVYNELLSLIKQIEVLNQKN